MVYISPGNLRMDYPTWSIPAEDTCPGSTALCRKFCYAKKAERQYKNVRTSRQMNLQETQKDDFVPNVINELSKRKSHYIRIHESGDFYSQEYLNKWMAICRALPDKSFLVYTQNFTLDYSAKPSNLVVYYSVWPDSVGVPDGLRAYVVDSTGKKLTTMAINNTFTCPKGHTIEKCNQCNHCYDGRGDVVFEIH
jgi:hypothetical protein